MRVGGKTKWLQVLFAGVAVIAFLSCGEAPPAQDKVSALPLKPPANAAASKRVTNADLFADDLARLGEGLDDEAEKQAVADFRKVWAKHGPVFRSRFLGIPTMQNPLDAWVFQELIVEQSPDFIIEAGTAFGGSAVLWAMYLEQVNPNGRVITIDIEDRRVPGAKNHPIAKRKVDFLLGSSTDPAIVKEVTSRVRGKKVLVLLDSLHTKAHVADELAAYSPLIGVGGYVVVQDTPVGPIDAVHEFVEQGGQFEIDKSRERFSMTNSVDGYLRRIR